MDNITNYIRMAMMFEGNHSQTFTSNLVKMIELILNQKAPEGFLISDIVSALSTEYGLNFVDIEVDQAVSSQRGKKDIVCINPDTRKYGERKYTLTIEASKRIDAKTKTAPIRSICERFLASQEDIILSADELVDLIDRYFYRCFNANATTILQLLNQEVTSGSMISDAELDFSFSVKEKEILNSFIYWNDEDKDKFVYQMVSCCFDYCTMTAKKDQAVYSTVFKNKVFVLDTNIIFRVIGINRDNRKVVIDAFLSKCQEVGITIAVTNETRAEIHNTIAHNVEQIKNLISNTVPVNPRFVCECANTGINQDFYQFYYEWCRNGRNKRGDLEGFKDYLINKADRICRQFSDLTFTSFATISKEKFEAYTQSLKEYKESKRGYARDEAVHTDVNNFMYVVGKNERCNSNDFFGLSYFHISADHYLCNWAKEIRNGAIPEVVLPSVWYSIILHYSGRATKDDYASFTRFLNFSMSVNDGEQSPKKTLLLQKVAKLDEPVDIKEEILIDVGKKLSTDYRDADDNAIDELISEANQTITEQRVSEAVAETEHISEEKMDAYKAEIDHQISDIEYRHETEINELKAEMQKREDKYIEENENVARETLIARKEERQKHIELEARKTAKKKRIWYIVFFLPCVLAPIAALVWVWIRFGQAEKISEGTALVLPIIVSSVSVLFEFLVYKLLYENWFCEFKIEKIEEREKKKLDKEYPVIV